VICNIITSIGSITLATSRYLIRSLKINCAVRISDQGKDIFGKQVKNIFG
jgi:hypothetical protein